MKASEEAMVVIIFLSVVVTLALVLTDATNRGRKKEASEAFTGKTCKVVEIDLYRGLESVKCDNGVIYTYKK
jgi:hypothetical protein